MRIVERRETIASLVSASALNALRDAIIIALLLKAWRYVQVENDDFQTGSTINEEMLMLETPTWLLLGINQFKPSTQSSDTRELDKDQVIDFFGLPLAYLKFCVNWYTNFTSADSHRCR